MPEWEKIVAERLGRMKLAPEERAEVIEELATHLGECYDELREARSPDPEGYTLAQVPDWNALGRKIQRSKEGPMNKTARIFLCGCLTAGLAAVLGVAGLLFVPTDFLPDLKATFYPSFPASLPRWFGPIMAIASGIWTIWFYTVMRSSHRPGTKTAAMTGLAVWIVIALAAAYFSSLGHVPFNVFLVTAAGGLPAWVAGTLAGAWLYEASERKPLPELKPA